MKTKERYKELLKAHQAIQEAAKLDAINILKGKGEITFDWENDDAPSFGRRMREGRREYDRQRSFLQT